MKCILDYTAQNQFVVLSRTNTPENVKNTYMRYIYTYILLISICKYLEHLGLEVLHLD